MNKKKLVLIFDYLDTVHLYKDVTSLISYPDNITYSESQIYTCSKHYFNNQFLPYKILQFKFPIFETIYLRIKVFNQLNSGDILFLYHGGFNNYFLAFLTKLYKPNVKTILKLDLDDFNCHRLLKKNNFIEKFKFILRSYLGKSFDIYLTETLYTYHKLKQIKPYKKSILLLPNGINAINEYSWDIKKEKIIVVSGRIGAIQKNHELVLNAFASIKHYNGFKLFFIGTVTPNFLIYFNELLCIYPHLSKNVVFTGNIDDRQILYNYYKKASIICFSSFYEGFSIAMLESLYYGCYLLSTDLAVANDLSFGNKFGKIIEINKELLDLFDKKNISNNIKYLQSNHKEILNSKWFCNSVLSYSKALEDVISNFNINEKNSILCSKEIYKNYNIKKISTTFNTYLI
jgi:glycosyltransferase involved in cell wall biosynthesis